MKLISIYTLDTEILKDDWFLKTLKDNWKTEIRYLDANLEGGGDYLSRSWYFAIRKKIEYIIEEIRRNTGDTLIWADIDIQFFRKCEDIINRAIRGKDIVFQAWREGVRGVNSGFMAIRCNERTLSFFEAVLRYEIETARYADQDAINYILNSGQTQLRWSVFPKQIYSVQLGIAPVFDIALHHACSTRFPHYNEEKGRGVGSVELKVEQLTKIREIVGRPVFWKIVYIINECIVRVLKMTSYRLRI